MRQSINRVERGVRKALGLLDMDEYLPDAQTSAALIDPAPKAELERFEESFDF